MRVNAVIPESFVDGPGVRSVVFFQGCPHNCLGCHNPGTHAYDSEDAFDLSVADFLRVAESHEYLAGVTLSGGEPFSERNLAELCLVAAGVHDMGKTVWAFTGYTLYGLIEYLDSLPLMVTGKRNAEFVLGHIDVLVDGPYCFGLRDTSLHFRGSSNQRVIRVPDVLAGYRVGMSESELDALVQTCLVEE